MAENIPNTPAGAVPPKPAEAAKVQPKKETVRINLPPKPTASPTIKIPAPSAVAAATPAQAAPSAIQTQAAASAPAPAASASTPRAAASAPRSAPINRPMAGGGVGTADKALAIVAMVIAVAVVVRVFLLTGMS